MRPKLSQSTGGEGGQTTVSTSSATVPSTSPQSSSPSSVPITISSSQGVINPVFISDHLVDSPRGPAPPPPTKPKPKTPPQHLQQNHQKSRTSSSSSSNSSSSKNSSSNNTVLTTASGEVAGGVLNNGGDNNRRTLTTSSAEVGSVELELQASNSSPSTSVKAIHRSSGSEHPASPNSSCDYCYRFHVSNHHFQTHPQQQRVPVQRRISPSSRGVYYDHHPQFQPYAPYPPQWYYLLGADSKEFRKHKHSHYRKDCKVCRAIVRQTFEQYYLGATAGSPVGTSPNGSQFIMSGSRDRVEQNSGRTESPDSIVPMSLLSDGHSDPLLADSVFPSTQLPFVILPRRRANCGHSCLKYSILFYSSAAVILAICFICYLTRIFGYLETMPGVQFSTSGTPVMSDQNWSEPEEMLPTSVPSTLFVNNETTVKSEMLSIVSTTLSSVISSTTESSVLTEPAFSTSPSTSGILDNFVRTEVVGIIVSSALMIIFFLGLIGAFLESVLALRIFGAILSYLFLLTFGAALYTVILLLIAALPAKLVLSAISCSAVAITLHAALAIAPFAFADLINQERQDEKNELRSTYFKYPSVRFLPSGAPSGKHARKVPRRRGSYFSLSFLNSGGGRVWNSRARMAPYPIPHHPHPNLGHHQRVHSSVPPSSSRTSPVVNNNQIDNLSSEGLIPPVQQQHSSTVRFNDNWI